MTLFGALLILGAIWLTGKLAMSFISGLRGK